MVLALPGVVVHKSLVSELRCAWQRIRRMNPLVWVKPFATAHLFHLAND